MRILVFGGRRYGDVASLKGDSSHPQWAQRCEEYRFITKTLDQLAVECCAERKYSEMSPRDLVIISGRATGADSVAIDWAVANGCQVEEYPAKWDDFDTAPVVIRRRRDGSAYNAAAGAIRNQKMIDVGRPDIGVGFPGGRGTSDMCARLEKAGIEVRRVGW